MISAENDTFMDSLLDSSQPRLFRLGSIADTLRFSHSVTPRVSEDQSEKALEAAKNRGRHRHKRVSNDLTSKLNTGLD